MSNLGLDMINQHLNVHKSNFCVIYREETTMRYTVILGLLAMKSPVRKKRTDFVSSFSSPDISTTFSHFKSEG